MGDLTVLTVPVGVAAAWEVPLSGRGTLLVTRIEPRLAYQRAMLAEFYRVTAPFSMIGGSGVTRGRWSGGIEFEWTPEDAQRWAAGFRVIMAF
jgi:hypothetical protein